MRTKVVAVPIEAALQALIVQRGGGAGGGLGDVIAHLGLGCFPVERTVEHGPGAIGESGWSGPEGRVEAQWGIQQFIRITIAAEESQYLLEVGEDDAQGFERRQPPAHVRKTAEACGDPFLHQQFEQDQRPLT
jgi:hypothetical protein